MAEKTEAMTEQKGPVQHPLGVQDKKPAVAQGNQATSDLVGRLQHGDRAAAEELVDRFSHRIYLYLRQLGHGRETSEDLAQEVFMKAWYHLGQLRDGGALPAWLFRIAHNVSSQHRRRHYGREAGIQEALQAKAEDQEGHGIQEDRVAQMDQLRSLQRAVEDLPWKVRQTVVLHYLQGFPISAAAQVVGIREGTFKSRLNRALVLLREEFDPDRGTSGAGRNGESRERSHDR